MTKKLLVARIGLGSLTVAFCATLPGCNLAVQHTPRCDFEFYTYPCDAGDQPSDTATTDIKTDTGANSDTGGAADTSRDDRTGAEP